MHQKTRLTGNPAFFAVEINADQSEIFFVWQIEAARIPMGAAVIGFLNHAIAANQESVAPVGKGHIKWIGLGLEILGLPWTGDGNWQAGGHTSTEANADQNNQSQIQEWGEELGHGWTYQRKE